MFNLLKNQFAKKIVPCVEASSDRIDSSFSESWGVGWGHNGRGKFYLGENKCGNKWNLWYANFLTYCWFSIVLTVGPGQLFSPTMVQILMIPPANKVGAV